jgi:hypothetical protein
MSLWSFDESTEPLVNRGYPPVFAKVFGKVNDAKGSAIGSANKTEDQVYKRGG